MTDWGHVTEIAAAVISAATGGSVPVLLYIKSNKKQAKADAERRQEDSKADADKRQAELKVALDGLVIERKYFPAHRHKEDPGETLMADGIQYPPNGKGK